MSAVTKRDDFNPITRNRSSSANEASRPSQILQRRQTHVGTKPFNVSTTGGKFCKTFINRLSFYYYY